MTNSTQDPSPARWLRSDGRPPRISFGGDYNPDQWPRSTWEEDVRLMKKAHVDIVSVAIFSWAQLQPTANTWDFEWLDDVLDLLHQNGIMVDLATATASPPAWLTRAHPDVLPRTARGEIVWPGARQHWRPTSPTFRDHALRLVEKIASRYAHHPALAAWHVSNELGGHNIWDYSDDAARAFRLWLIERYGDVDGINHAWGTAFWSQRYSTVEEILPPRLAAAHVNPGQQLDFRRFSSDALKRHLIAERSILRRHTPDVPVTSNFMVFDGIEGMDYADWAHEVDFVSNDHYVTEGPGTRDELSFSANLVGNLGRREPWFLMEHAVSAVNWKPVNVPKARGEIAADALTHVAHGADAVCYFQWRQSRAGAEKFHSAMLPHAGENSDTFRAIVDLGSQLSQMTDLVGSRRERAQVAILFDWESWWASEQDSHHTERFKYRQAALAWYVACLDSGLRADVLPAHADFSEYPVVLASSLHMISQTVADRLTTYAEGGGHLIVTYNSGVVDANDHAWLGGYLGPLRDVLGVRVEEIHPLREGDVTQLSTGARATLWTEHVDIVRSDVTVTATYSDGPLAGRPAATMRPAHHGMAYYVSADLDRPERSRYLDDISARAGVVSELPESLRGRVEIAARVDDGRRYVFVINRSAVEIDISEINDTHAPRVLNSPGATLLRTALGTALHDISMESAR
ncbi:beta-galactosidase [uncultured Microbacterium sp.]|uniref:beta-galactosidase n=1 Tax=uncultured Microbacterium sp. TaxID=191216 RepID=UPI0028E62B6B|nr:beta-galactosidase [uncultured Microbacterium sp.]